MSDINLDFTVNNNSINFTVEPNDITITPTDIQLTFTTGSQLNAGGSNTQLQYNNNSLLAGIPNVTYNGSKLSLGNVANVQITGGTNGYVLQTDGTGNLSWTAQTGNGGGGNGTPGGANTQIQYNDSGSFGGNAGFTFNEVDGNVNMPANLIVAGNIIGNTSNANYANFAGTAFNVSGSNVTGAVANATYANTANLATYATTANAVAGANVSGAVSYATTANSVAGANVSGQVANALVAGTVYTNAQPNITSVGTLVNLSVTGNITSLSGVFVGNGAGLTNLNGSNISNVANANYAAYAGNIITAAQPNITSVGTLANLTVTGNATFNSPIFIESGSERFTANTGTPSGTVVLNLSNSSTLYAITNNANANITLNITNISTVSVANSSVVATYIYTNGANAYSINNLELDGTAVSIKWAGATPPTAYASSTMVYTFTILYIGGVGYDIIGTGTRYA